MLCADKKEFVYENLQSTMLFLAIFQNLCVGRVKWVRAGTTPCVEAKMMKRILLNGK
jgi:hypothetical protein